MFADQSFRLVNTSDIVVTVPPPIQIPGVVKGYFSHVETPVDFTKQTKDIENNHAMETYLSALGEARGR